VLTLAELERAAPLLEARLEGHRLQALVQSDPTTLLLTTYGGASEERSGVRRHVLLSCRSETARVSLPATLPSALPEPPTFTQHLRGRIVGARLRSVRLLDEDRQLLFELEKDDTAYGLLLSIFGRRSNLYLLENGSLIAALRPLRETRSELALGEAWRGPSAGPPRRGEDRFAGIEDDALLAEIEVHYASVERDDACARQRKEIAKVLRREAGRVQRKLERVENELVEANVALDCERQGELLKSVLANVSRGDERALARDFEHGKEVEIPLDPLLSPAQNMERLFKRARKAVRTLTAAGAREQDLKTGHAELTGLLAELEAIQEGEGEEIAEALAQLAAQPALARLLVRRASRSAQVGPRREKPKRGKGDVPARMRPRRYATAGGLEIWVGRSDAGNDYLTTRLARGKDLFFHLAEAPGSHVILRTQGRSDPPSEALLDACELAAQFSKHKNASRVDVHVVPIANVRKPKGAKPGLVMVHGGKIVHLRRIPGRLERVLAARIEES